MAGRKIDPELRLVPYKPRPHTVGPRPQNKGPRPHVWKVGPDARLHDQYTAWLKHRAQAEFRGEPHYITFDEWHEIWEQDGNWDQRGRVADSINLSRHDPELPWTKDNCRMATRQQLMRERAALKRGKTYKPYKTRTPRIKKI